MVKEFRQNISTKESLLYCIFGGAFVYLVCAIPRILFYLDPPTLICIADPPILNKYSFIIGFGLFTILGIYLLKWVNLKKRLLHFSFLGLVLAIGGGILSGLLEFFYHYIFVMDSENRRVFYIDFQEHWFEMFWGVFQIGWMFVFLFVLLPFTITFLTATSIIKKFSKRNSLR